MPRKTVLDRIARISLKVAEKVSRKKIGSLRGALFYQVVGESKWIEVPIISFEDQGVGESQREPGVQASGNSYGVKILRSWWDANRNKQVNYAIKMRVDRTVADETEPLIPVELESHTQMDNEVYTQATFRIALQMEVF